MKVSPEAVSGEVQPVCSRFRLLQPASLLLLPLLNAPFAELALLETEILKPLIGRNVFFKINIIQTKSRAFNFILDEAPENGLHAA